MNSRIELHRLDGYHRDRLRAYQVIIDRRRAGTVREGDVASFDVAPGAHTVELRIAWCRSRRIAIDVESDSTLALQCHPNAEFSSALAAITIGRSDYIELAPLRNQTGADAN